MAHSAGPARRVSNGGGGRVRALVDGLAFGCELAMIVVLGIAGWSLGSRGLISIALLIFYPALAVLIWTVWVAPQATRRAEDPWRLVIQLALFAGTAALSAAGGHALLGIVFGAVGWLTFIGLRLLGHPAAGSTQAGPSEPEE